MSTYVISYDFAQKLPSSKDEGSEIRGSAMAENNLSEMGNENFFLTGNKCAFSISEDEEHGRILYVEPVSDNLFYAFGSGMSHRK